MGFSTRLYIYISNQITTSPLHASRYDMTNIIESFLFSIYRYLPGICWCQHSLTSPSFHMPFLQFTASCIKRPSRRFQIRSPSWTDFRRFPSLTDQEFQPGFVSGFYTKTSVGFIIFWRKFRSSMKHSRQSWNCPGSPTITPGKFRVFTSEPRRYLQLRSSHRFQNKKSLK